MMQTAPAAAAVVKALRATEKRMAKSLSKNKKMNYISAKRSKQQCENHDVFYRLYLTIE